MLSGRTIQLDELRWNVKTPVADFTLFPDIFYFFLRQAGLTDPEMHFLLFQVLFNKVYPLGWES